MSSVEEDVVRAKEKLQNALGDRFVDYMQSMKKWFSGKVTKQEFDREAREIVTPSYVHLHNEFLLCIITKCNNFTSVATDAATKTIFPMIQPKNVPKAKKKLKPGEPGSNPKPTSYHLRFAPVDPIKHAPSIITASIETASLASQNFSLEFCARERSLPYAKMIHDRMLLTSIDFNLKQIDTKAVFLLAEATQCMLKNIITKLVSRSKFKHQLRCLSTHENYIRKRDITDARVLENQKRRLKSNSTTEQFEVDPNLFSKLKNNNLIQQSEMDVSQDEDSKQNEQAKSYRDANEAEELKQLSNDLNNSLIVPVKKLPITLYDLKNLLEINKSKLMPSHSIYTINMEKIICNLWHENENESIE